MLITDIDREKYLRNAYKCLKPGAAMYFVHEGYRDDIYDGEVTSYEQWLELVSEDVDTPEERLALKDGKEFTVMIPRIAARPRSDRGYREELTKVGFEIIQLEMVERWVNVNILARKPPISKQ